jgi:transporter family-2 protein
MFVAGTTVALQPAINSRLARKVGVLQSACISFTVGAIALLLLAALTARLTFKGISDTVWWEWTGGLLGAAFVTATIFVVPRIGAAALMAATVAAQLITGMVMDHYAVLGLERQPVDLKRVLGAFLLLTGVALISKK